MFRLYFLLIFFVFVLTTTTLAQRRFFGGFYAGIAASQISGDQLSGFNKAGICIGGFTNYYFTESSALQVEICYIQKGSRKNQKPKINDYTVYKLNLQYIEMPILYHWFFSKRFYLETGPYWSVLLKTYNVEKDESGLVPNYNRPRFNLFDFGVLAGLGINITDNFKANIRFENSILPVRKPEVGTAWRLDRWQYNSTITLSAIYQI